MTGPPFRKLSIKKLPVSFCAPHTPLVSPAAGLTVAVAAAPGAGEVNPPGAGAPGAAGEAIGPAGLTPGGGTGTFGGAPAAGGGLPGAFGGGCC